MLRVTRITLCFMITMKILTVTMVTADKYTMCTLYEILQDDTRSTLYKTNEDTMAVSDSDINDFKWFLLMDSRGKPQQLPSQPPSRGQCGTAVPGWLWGRHPVREDGPVKRDVCFAQIDDRCVARLRVQVRRCYGHYVYKFQKTTFPFKARYCQERDSVDERPMIYKNMSPESTVLQGHVITSFRAVKTKTHCFIYCLLTRECLSFNYSRRAKRCELNSTRVDETNLFVKREGFRYYEKLALTNFMNI